MDEQTQGSQTASNNPNQNSGVQDSSNTRSATINLNGVEGGYSTYLRKRWWLVLLVGALSAGIAFANIFYGVIFFVIVLLSLRRFYENNLFQAFASANRFNYQKKGVLGNQTGLVFSIGHSERYSDIVSGAYQAWPFLLFMYAYTVGYGRNSHRYNRAVMAIPFNVALPAFVLRRHKIFQILEEEGESLRSNGYSEKVNLEGDFNKHFQVYIKPNSQDDVLSILAPDVMQILIGLDKYEIEMTTNGVFYIYCHGYITKKQSLVDMYKIAEAITAKIGRYANRVQELHQVVAQA